MSIKYAKAFTNLVRALSSYEKATTVVELSESPVFHHQYSSIRDGIAGVGQTPEEQSQTMASVRQLGFNQLAFSPDEWILLITDATSIEKPHSDCLEDRQYVKINNNVIRQNQPISVGYAASLVCISPNRDGWSPPLDVRRIGSDQSANECAVEQIDMLMRDVELGLGQQNVINTLDSSYGCPAYLSPVHDHQNLVNVVRLRYGKKVWLSVAHRTKEQPDNQQQSSTGSSNKGAPKVYGDKYYLTDASANKTYRRKDQTYQVYQQSIFDLNEDDYIVLEGQTAKKRKLKVQVWRWDNLLIRSKDGQSMKDKPFDLIASRVVDAQTGELVFKKTMFTTIHGQHKDQISTQQAFEAYRQRYDIEPTIKFAKQKLLLDKYQTPDKQHFDNWLVVVMTALWLLFVARDEATYRPKKWQKYKEVNKKAVQNQDEKKVVLTPSQTRQAAQDLFLTFDQRPFLPKISNKGKGRELGTQLIQRTRYPVVKKSGNRQNFKLTTEKIE